MEMETGMEDGVNSPLSMEEALKMTSDCCGADDCDCEHDSLEGQEIALPQEMSEIYAEGVRNGILCEAAISASKEADFIAEMASKCRMELFDILLKSDLDKEKIKEKVKSLQEFMASSERRTDDLIMRVERLLKKH